MWKMNNNKLKEINIENCPCYYFDDIINIYDLDVDNILIDEKSYKSILNYDIAYKTRYIAKPLGIIFERVDEYIRKYDGIKYPTLFHSNKNYQRIIDRIRYLISYYVRKQYFRHWDVYSHMYIIYIYIINVYIYIYIYKYKY